MAAIGCRGTHQADMLQVLVSGSPSQSELLARLGVAVDATLAALGRDIELRRSSGFEPARERLVSAGANEPLDDVRRSCPLVAGRPQFRLVAAEREQLARR